MRRLQTVRWLARAPGAALLISLAWITITNAKSCPRKGTLGTSRILKVDAVDFPQVGLKSFPQTLPLRDHEVVLTFDDGAWPPTTPKVLAALAKECVLATFFMIGKPASEHPTMVRRVAAEGHTAWGRDHDSDDAVLPLSRLLTTPATLDLLQSRRIVVFGADFWGNDWDHIQPARELWLLTWRLKMARKGIILLHDSQPRTAAMLPAFLRYLRDHHYHVVHIVPTGPAVDFDGVP